MGFKGFTWIHRLGYIGCIWGYIGIYRVQGNAHSEDEVPLEELASLS